MAELLFKSQSTYCRIENGESTITPEDLKKIADVLECSVGELDEEYSVISILEQYRVNKEAGIKAFRDDQGFILKTILNYIRNSNDEMKTLISEQHEQTISLIKELFVIRSEVE